MRRLPERRLKPVPAPAAGWRLARCNPLGVQERCPVRALKETDGTPKSCSIRTTVVNMGSPKGRESYGDGVPTVIAGVTSDQSGDR